MLMASYGTGKILASYGTGRMLAAIEGHALLVGVLFALLAAVVAWAVFHLIAPAYEAVAAIVAFVIVLLLLLL